MTDDYAIEGEEGGYVPCFELPAVLVVEEEGAISGHAGGRVPRDTAAGSLPAPERAAIVGSAVGFVAKPCVESGCCCDTFTRVVGSGWGTSEICSNPNWLAGAGAGGATSVDGSAATIAWLDNLFNPGALNAARYLPLAFTGLPVEFRTRIKCSASNESTIMLGNVEFFAGGGPTASIWLVAVLGLDIRITIDGPNGGIASAILVGAFPAFDTYINIQVLCEGRSMSIRAWNVGDPDPGGWQATATYSSGFAACATPTLIEYMGGTFSGSGASDYLTVDELCIIQGFPCECAPAGTAQGVNIAYRRYTPETSSPGLGDHPPVVDTVSSIQGAFGLAADGRGGEITIQYTIPAGLAGLRLAIAIRMGAAVTTGNAAHLRCYTDIPFDWELRRAGWGASFTPTYDAFQLDTVGSLLAVGTWTPPVTICNPVPPFADRPSTFALTTYTDDFLKDGDGKIQLQLRISDLNAAAALDYNSRAFGSGSWSPSGEAGWDDYLYSHSVIYTQITACAI